MLHYTGTVALSLKDKVLVEGGSTEICLDFLHPSVNCSAFNISFEAYFKYGVNSDGNDRANISDYYVYYHITLCVQVLQPMIVQLSMITVNVFLVQSFVQLLQFLWITV